MSHHNINHKQVQCNKILAHPQQEINPNKNQAHPKDIILTHPNNQTPPIISHQNLHRLLTPIKSQLTTLREVSIIAVATGHIQGVVIKQLTPATAIEVIPPVIADEGIDIHQQVIELAEEVIEAPLVDIDGQHLASEGNLIP